MKRWPSSTGETSRRHRYERHLQACQRVSFACILKRIPEGALSDPDPTKRISPVLTAGLAELHHLVQTYEEPEPGDMAPEGELRGFDRYVADVCNRFVAAGLKVQMARKTRKTEADGVVVLLIIVPDRTFAAVLGALEYERFVTSGRGATISESLVVPVRTDYEKSSDKVYRRAVGEYLEVPGRAPLPAVRRLLPRAWTRCARITPLPPPPGTGRPAGPAGADGAADRLVRAGEGPPRRAIPPPRPALTYSRHDIV
jgi:hypothetical protein